MGMTAEKVETLRKSIGDISALPSERQGAALDDLRRKFDGDADISEQLRALPATGGRDALSRFAEGLRAAPATPQLASPTGAGAMGRARSRSETRTQEEPGAPQASAAPAMTAPNEAPVDPQSRSHVITDPEGQRDRLDAVISAGKLRRTEAGVELADKNDRLVMNGDTWDRGPDSISIVRDLTAAKKADPDSVTLIHGNRDPNRMYMPRDVEALERTPTAEYQEWLTKNGGENTQANRVDYWLDTHAAGKALEFHRQELESTARKTDPNATVTREAAAADYVKKCSPGGEFFEYLKLGQLAKIDGPTLYVHGGITETNMGMVPGASQPYENPHEWVAALNAWHKQQMTAIEDAYRTGGPLPQELLRYSDSNWDPTAKHNFPNASSIIYGLRNKEDGNLRAPTAAVRDYLARGGITTVVVGHTPAGDVPTPLRAGNKFVQVMGDTSFGTSSTPTLMSVDPRGGVWVTGATAKGSQVSYRVNGDTPYVGHVVDVPTREDPAKTETYTIVGRARTGKPGGLGGAPTEYLLARYAGGYAIDERTMSLAELQKLGPKPAEMIENNEAEANRKVLMDNLARRGITVHDQHMVSELIAGRRVNVFSGPSAYGKLPAAPAYTEQQVRDIVARLDPKKDVIITGGTDLGIEKLVHQLASERGIQTIGVINEGTVPGEVNIVRDVVVAGGREGYHDSMAVQLVLAQEYGGGAFFLGGGGVVSRGIERAQTMGVPYMLMRGTATQEADGGASAKQAMALQTRDPGAYARHTFETADEAWQRYNALFPQ